MGIWSSLKSLKRMVFLADPEDISRLAEFDNYFKALLCQTIEHHKLHEGYTWKKYIHSANLAVTTMNVAFKTLPGDKLAHMLFGFSSNDEILFEIIEGATWTQGSGTALDLVAVNRAKGGTSEVILEDKAQVTFTASNQVIKDVTSVAGGTVIDDQYTYNASLGANKFVESRSAGHEWPLKPNTSYVVRMTKTDQDCKMTIGLIHYEHEEE